MGRFQQLRAKAITLRGAIAIGGALALAASMAQASGTLAQSTELREAKAGIATQNYYPTPLVSNVRCSTNWDNSTVTIRWDPPTGVPASGDSYQYRLYLQQDQGGSHREDLGIESGTSISLSVNSGRRGKGLFLRVHTVNGPAESSGWRSQGMSTRPNINYFYGCSGNNDNVNNATWENQYDWDPDVIPFATGPSPSIFGWLIDEDADLLAEFPEGNELTSLDDAALDASPDRSEQATTSPSSTPTSPTPSNPTSSRSTSTSTSPGATSAGEDATEPTLSAPVATSSPTVQATSAAASSTVKSTPSSSTPAAPSTAERQSVRAGVGDGPIAVGASQARLDDVDGRTRLSVTRGGSEVCTAEVDGASRIESSGGVLTVTVSGRTSPVDLETCEQT